MQLGLVSRTAALLAFSAALNGPFGPVAGVVHAQSPRPTPAEDPAAAKPAEAELTPEEKQERELRRACKVALCTAFHVRKPPAGDVTCAVVKTWRKEQITRMIGRGGIAWPYGAARCTTDLKFKRETLIRAVAEPDFEAQFDSHAIKCDIEHQPNAYALRIEIAPRVTFKDGRAVKATLNWGKIDAPLLAKSALWSAAAADNSFGALQKTVVDDINAFIGAKCAEVKDEWTGK